MKLNNENLLKISGGGNMFAPFAQAFERIARALHIRYLMYILFVD